MVISLHRQSGAESIVVCYSSVGSSSGISSASVAWSTPVESYKGYYSHVFGLPVFSEGVCVRFIAKYILRSFESFAVGSVDCRTENVVVHVVKLVFASVELKTHDSALDEP